MRTRTGAASFTRRSGHGVLVIRSSPAIENCTISGNGDDGIEMQDASPVIRGCLVAQNDWAMMVNPHCAPRIEGNRFVGNKYGIAIDGSSPVVRRNTFENNTHSAIRYYDNSEPLLSNNTLAANGAGVVRDLATESYFSICAAVVTIAGVLALSAVLARIRRKRQGGEPGPGP